MAFGKRNANAAGGYDAAQFSRQDANRHSLSATSGAFEIRFGAKDVMLGGALIAFFFWYLGPYFHGASMSANGFFMAMIAGFCLLAGVASAVMGLAGRVKFKADASGIHGGQLFGGSHIEWPEIAGFEMMSVNFNKIVFVKSHKSGGVFSETKITVPHEAFKSTKAEFLTLVAKHRPDLLPVFVAVMNKIGAKKLARELLGEAI